MIAQARETSFVSTTAPAIKVVTIPSCVISTSYTAGSLISADMAAVKVTSTELVSPGVGDTVIDVITTVSSATERTSASHEASRTGCAEPSEFFTVMRNRPVSPRYTMRSTASGLDSVNGPGEPVTRNPGPSVSGAALRETLPGRICAVRPAGMVETVVIDRSISNDKEDQNVSDFGDFDELDALDHEPADPEQVARKLREFLHERDSAELEFDDLTNEQKLVLIAVVADLLDLLRRQGSHP